MVRGDWRVVGFVVDVEVKEGEEEEEVEEEFSIPTPYKTFQNKGGSRPTQDIA